ncbi:MAG: 1,4-dihydroxy-2-naphthoate polyprenyltransferase [Cytophagaceae bacterium]|nr:1,4-dihydroxy-2-naphthoate polyprenyltransferase [Cytophagaceae bacterium]
MKIKLWLQAFRLRTLPLAFTSIGMGATLAWYEMLFSWPVLIAAAVTTLFLQILSNLANDYGDFHNGADNEQRVGPLRAMQSGSITEKEMKNAIIVFILLSLLSGCGLLYVVFKSQPFSWLPIAFFLLGIASIAAAVKYTAGKNPYGYKGLGDVFVFLFFGWVGVGGTYFLMTREWDWTILLPATTIGLFSAAVLNVNNIRDIEADRSAGKKTLALRLGPVYARWYHVLLIIAGITCMTLFVGIENIEYSWLLCFAFLPVLWNAFKVYSTKESERIDPFLKQMVFSSLTFLLIFILVVSL